METRIRPAHFSWSKESDPHCRVLAGLTIPRTLEAIPIFIRVKYGLVGSIAAQEGWFSMTRKGV